MFGNGRSIEAEQCTGIIISGDNNQNISIHYGPTDARLAIPFKPKSLTDSIDSLLNWQSQLTPLIGRDATAEALLLWATTGPRISIKLIHGEGGVGKTRLAFEVASTLRDQDWEAGQLARLGSGSAFRLGVNGTLLIIDYPEQQPERVQQLLQAIKDSEEPATPLRILLLSRRPQLLDQLGVAHYLAAAPLPLASLDKEQAAWSLMTAAWPQLCNVRKIEERPLIDQALFKRWLGLSETHAQPLFILAYALNLMEEPHATALSGGEIIQRLVQREVVRLKAEGRAKKLNELALPLLKGLAAITGGITAKQLNVLAESPSLSALLPSYDQLRDCALWQEEDGTGKVVELQPDLLAAALLSQLLKRDDDQPGEWLYAALDVSSDIENATSRLGRLIHDATQRLGLPWPQTALIEAVQDDLSRCRRIDAGLSRDYLERPLLPLALHVGRMLADATEEPAEQARLLNTLSVNLAESGDRAAGLTAIQQAVEIHEQLATDNFAAYGPDLAMSLNNLSIRLAEGGDRAAGLAVIQRAVEIREALAADNFAAYGPDLAMSLNNLSLCLAEGGDRAGGLVVIQRAVEIHEALAGDNFAAYGPDLASSLNNLSNRLVESGDRAGGLAAIQRAVEIREALAKDNFAAYGPALARSLNNLSVDLADSGDRAGGLKAIQRAVEIYEALAKDNFAAYGPVLASSLNNLSIRLAESGDRDAGLAAIQRAVEIDEALAADNFAAYGPVLASSLNNLSIRLAEGGDRAAGLAASERAVEIREALAKDNFAAYGPALARSLNNLSIRLAEGGDRAAGLAAIERAIELITPYAVEGTTYGDWLAGMKRTLLSYQAESDGNS